MFGLSFPKKFRHFKAYLNILKENVKRSTQKIEILGVFHFYQEDWSCGSCEKKEK